MAKSPSNYITKLYDELGKDSNKNIIRWNSQGDAFEIIDTEALATQVNCLDTKDLNCD